MFDKNYYESRLQKFVAEFQQEQEKVKSINAEIARLQQIGQESVNKSILLSGKAEAMSEIINENKEVKKEEKVEEKKEIIN